MTYAPGSIPSFDEEVSDDAKRLKIFLERVLDTIVAQYEAYNMPVPTRRYWTIGLPPVDCEQLVVSFQQMYLGAPGAQVSSPQKCEAPRTATFSVSVARPVPSGGQNGGAPSTASLTKAATVAAYDAWILMESAAALDQWEEGGYGMGVIATVDTLQPEGGFQVVTLSCTTSVP
jgi:hypothetical protein